MRRNDKFFLLSKRFWGIATIVISMVVEHFGATITGIEATAIAQNVTTLISAVGILWATYGSIVAEGGWTLTPEF